MKAQQDLEEKKLVCKIPFIVVKYEPFYPTQDLLQKKTVKLVS